MTVVLWHFLPMMGFVAGAARLVPQFPQRWRIGSSVFVFSGFLLWAVFVLPSEAQHFVVAAVLCGATLGLAVIPQKWAVPASIAIAILFLCWAPFLMLGFHTQQLFTVLVWFIAIMGLNMLTGFNGQISLGHGALVAFGAYVSAILIDGDSQIFFIDASPWPFWLSIIAAGCVTAVLGIFLGIPALRLSGPYLAIATFAFAISFAPVMRKYDGLTGGNEGIQVRRPPVPGFLGDTLDPSQWLYFLSLFIALIMLFLAWAILRGPLGRAFVAVRDSEFAAAAIGINVARTKVLAFSISSFFAGVAGGLYMQTFRLINPEAIQEVQSINLLVATVVGGLGSLLGSLIGAGTLIFIPVDAPGLIERIPGLTSIPRVEALLNDAPGVIQGALVILVMLTLPSGAAGLLHRVQRLAPSDVLASIQAFLGQIGSRIPVTARRSSRAAPSETQAPGESVESRGDD